MLVPINPIETVAVWRLLEFLNERMPWHRSLWGIGVVLALEEFYEACVAMRQGHLSEASVKRMASALQKRVGVHPAFTDAEKLFLRQQVQQPPRPDGPAHFAIRDLSIRVSADYLTRWGRVVASGNFTVEHFARSVAAYLLDAGFAAKYLADFIKARLNSPDAISLQQLCDALQAEMTASPRREFEALLAFRSVPVLPNGTPVNWLKGRSINDWLEDNGSDTAGMRAPIAVLVKVRARDAIGAAHAARNEFERYAARSLIATGRTLDRLPTIWIKGSPEPVALKEASRGVGVKELVREDRVFSNDASQSVDAALELLAHLEGSSPPAAIATGWAAIEGLLADPSDRSAAADNLATLVACSFPRAELTALSYRVQKEHAGQFPELENAETNRIRCRVLAQLIIENKMPPMPSASDQAAAARLKKLLGNPGPELQTIREAIGDSLHRLYRQRNLILHGARLDSVALTASLRTVSKLAGAGMDRITHGHYVQKLRPLELVAKANLALALVSRDHPLGCVDLLEIS